VLARMPRRWRCPSSSMSAGRSPARTGTAWWPAAQLPPSADIGAVLPTQTHPRWSPPATVAEQYLIPMGSWVSHACGHTAQMRGVRSPVLGSATSGCSSVVRMFVGLRLCCAFPRCHAYRRPLASPRRLTNRLRRFRARRDSDHQQRQDGSHHELPRAPLRMCTHGSARRVRLPRAASRCTRCRRSPER
jgi:hypothetical protein